MTRSRSRRSIPAAPQRSRSPGERPASPGPSCSAPTIPTRPPPTARRCTTWRMARAACRSPSPARSAPTATASTLPRPTLARALDGIYLDAVALDLDLSPQTKDAGQRIAGLVKQRGIAPAATSIRFGFDPIGAAATAGGSPLTWNALVPIFNAVISDLAGARLPRPVRAGRRTRDPQHRRVGGAGTRLCAGGRARLSACARSRRRRARSSARHDLFPPDRRRRPVPDHRQVPGAAELVGARRGRLRASTPNRPLSRPRPRGAC